MRHGRRRWWVVGVVAFFLLATAAKFCVNSVSDGFEDMHKGPVSETPRDASVRGVLVTELRIEGGGPFVVGEAWLEAAYEPSHTLVWFSHPARADWNYLCLRARPTAGTTTDYHLRPLGVTPILHRLGQHGVVFTLTNDGFYFLKVPADLRAFEIDVEKFPPRDRSTHTVDRLRLTSRTGE